MKMKVWNVYGVKCKHVRSFLIAQLESLIWTGELTPTGELPLHFYVEIGSLWEKENEEKMMSYYL